jgi:outer membrane lipoprotein-sorting protein
MSVTRSTFPSWFPLARHGAPGSGTGSPFAGARRPLPSATTQMVDMISNERQFIRVFAVLVFAILSCACAAVRPSSTAILDNVCRTYKNIKSYEDVGTVEETYPAHVPEGRVRMQFRTIFRRPEMFRLDYRSTQSVTEREQNFVIWGSSSAARQWSDAWGTRKTEVDNLKDGLESMAGVTSGVTAMIPNLLLGTAGCLCRPAALTEVLRAETINGRLCRVIRITSTGGHDFDVCIGSDYTVMGWTTRDDSDSGPVTTVVRYEPRFDVTIDDARFDFRPPTSPDRM